MSIPGSVGPRPDTLRQELRFLRAAHRFLVLLDCCDVQAQRLLAEQVLMLVRTGKRCAPHPDYEMVLLPRATPEGFSLASRLAQQVPACAQETVLAVGPRLAETVRAAWLQRHHTPPLQRGGCDWYPEADGDWIDPLILHFLHSPGPRTVAVPEDHRNEEGP